MSEISKKWSPYCYAMDNPIEFIDPDGMLTYDWHNHQYLNDDGEVVSNDDAIRQIQGMGETIYTANDDNASNPTPAPDDVMGTQAVISGAIMILFKGIRVKIPNHRIIT